MECILLAVFPNELLCVVIRAHIVPQLWPNLKKNTQIKNSMNVHILID